MAEVQASTADYAASARTSTSDLFIFTIQLFPSGSVRSYSNSEWL
jgi:hypothetical protein